MGWNRGLQHTLPDGVTGRPPISLLLGLCRDFLSQASKDLPRRKTRYRGFIRRWGGLPSEKQKRAGIHSPGASLFRFQESRHGLDFLIGDVTALYPFPFAALRRVEHIAVACQLFRAVCVQYDT